MEWDVVRKGLMNRVESTVSKTEYPSFDAMNRVASSRQRTNGVDYDFSYVYNLAGGLERERYPSGREVASCYDEAGRVSEVRQKQNATAAEVLVGKVTDYAEHGPVREMKIGPGTGVVTETAGYDSKRLQMRRVTAASAAESWTVKNFFCPTGLETDQCTGDSGNVLKQEGIGGLAWNYTYDPLNRLMRAVETVGGVEKWHQTMKYDPYGNRSVVNDAGTLITQEKAMPRVASEADASPFDAKNQWTGAQYDVGGNQQTSWGDGTEVGASKYRYDGEGKQVRAEVRYSASVTGVVEHGFDGEGRRVWKKVDGVVKTVFVYDAMGQLVAEYGESGTMPCGTCYLTADHLGSTRVVWGTDGRMKQLMDYAPFGEEVGANYRGGDVRYPGEVYPRVGGVGVSMKFTGKERDAESGLDYFGARYMSSSQGRFTSPDPLLASGRVGDPQSWNRYVYVRNNPLALVDPTGLDWVASGNANNPYSWVDTCGQGQTCYQSIAAVAGQNVRIYGSRGQFDMMDLGQNEYGRVSLGTVADGSYGFTFQDGVTATYATPGNAVAVLNTALQFKAGGGPTLSFNDFGNAEGTQFRPHQEHHGVRSGIDLAYPTETGSTNDINRASVARTTDLLRIARENGYSDPIVGTRMERQMVNGVARTVPSQVQFNGRHLPHHQNHIHLAKPRATR